MQNKKNKKNIPNGWSQILAGDIFSFVRTHAFSRDNLTNGISSNGDVGNIHYGDIHSTYNALKINLDNTPIPIVNDKKFNPDKEDLLVDGDLVMSDASEDYEGVGVTVLIDGIKDRKVVGGLHTFVLRDKKGITNKYYRQYIFRNPEVRNKLQKVANGVSVYGISKKEVSKILFSMPPSKEQEGIVKVLETWDDYIKKISKKIEIKKKIRSVLMKKILTGKMRLSGFDGEWKNNKLINLFKVSNEFVGEQKILPVAVGVNGIKRRDEIFSKELSQDYSRNKILKNNQICFGIGTNKLVYDVHLGNEYYCVSPAYKIFDVVNCNPYFLKIFLDVNNAKLSKSFMIISARQGKSVDFAGLLNKKMKFPSLDEQNVIADFFNKVEKEIKLIENKKRIIEKQKKYLLNNLVTGKIRLPEFQKVK